MTIVRRFALALATLAGHTAAHAEPSRPPERPLPPSILLVTAHPDDETIVAGAVAAVTRALGGTVDLAVITNGEGGFRYAALAEPLYGLDLTDERVARAHLSRIRQRELMRAAEVLGLRYLFFLGQPDRAFTRDAKSVLELEWNAPAVRARLAEILARGRYDHVLVPLPMPTTHGAHQAAAALALDAVAALPGERPAILGGTSVASDQPRPRFEVSSALPQTRVPRERPVLEFDRRTKADRESGLDYRVVVEWAVAEHKSQGALPAESRGEDLELYYEFAVNDDRAVAKAEALFGRLARTDAPSDEGRVESGENPPRWYGSCPIDR